MTAKSKPSYRVYEEHGSGRWRWEIATAEGQVIERGRARSAIEARAEAVRRGLGKTQSPDSGSKHKSEGDFGRCLIRLVIAVDLAVGCGSGRSCSNT